MARTALATQSVKPAGTAPTYTAANVDGHSVSMGVMLHVKNGGAAAITVTVQTPGTLDGLAIADRTVSVVNAGEQLISLRGPYDQGDGNAYVDFSAVTSVTVAAFQQG